VAERIQHGINGPEPPLFSRNVHPTTTPFKYIRDFATSHNKTSILKEAGPYIAEVIRVYDKYTLGQSTGKVPLDYWNHFEGDESGEIVIIRARIPEIDTFGIPQKLPVNDEDFVNLSSEDKHRVERYPKCIAKWLNMPRPAVGQAVWVDFRDPKNRSGRMYLGIVNSTQPNAYSSGAGSKDGFDNPLTPNYFPPTEPPKPYTGPVVFADGYNWAFPEGEVALTIGPGEIATLAMVGGNPRIRAFMRMITLHEGGARHQGPDNGVIASPYQLLVGGKVTTDPQKRAGRITKGHIVSSGNFFGGGYVGHPGIVVKWNPDAYGSSACGRFQFLGSTWKNWAARTRKRPGHPDRSMEEARADFSPANQDYATYQFMMKHKGAPEFGGVKASLLELLVKMGDTPVEATPDNKKIWKLIMKTAGPGAGPKGPRHHTPGPGKGIGGTWASLPYACYKNQSCIKLLADGGLLRDQKRYNEGIELYSALLDEENIIAEYNADLTPVG